MRDKEESGSERGREDKVKERGEKRECNIERGRKRGDEREKERWRKRGEEREKERWITWRRYANEICRFS